MRSWGYAAAWVPFYHEKRMEEVKCGDAIFMYANRTGIIGIGRAKGQCEKLEPGNPDRIRGGSEEPEWRVPVDWLVWRSSKDSYRPERREIRNQTFSDVTGEEGLLGPIRGHFLVAS
jgi:hypothetical protein